MTDWTSGYVADIGYTFGYYRELNPLRVKLAFLSAGLVYPEIGTACELGFGQGISVNLHASASVTSWHGTDFNPSQASFAREMAQESGSGAQLFDDAFAEFAQRPDLPDFDYIGLHGIWSWVSDENRAVIVDFIRKKLKIGGVLYISYNTLPGWGTFAPLRHLMTDHAEKIGAEGHGIVSRIDGALDFTDKLLATNPMYSRANPQIAERLKKMKEENREYLAHEYFNRDWLPMHFSTMVDWLEPAKVQYACSAHYPDLINLIHLTPEQQAFLKEIPDALFRESVRDFMVNQQFRKDYWIKGARKLSVLDQADNLRNQRFILVSHRPKISLKVKGSLGEASLSEEIYNPILDILADHKIMTLGKLEKLVAGQGIEINKLLQVIIILSGFGHLAAAQDDEVIKKVKSQTDKINTYIMNRARASQEIQYLASPVTGGGIEVSSVQQLFLAELRQGNNQPADMARASWAILGPRGHKLIKDGKTLEIGEENIAALTSQAESFLTTRVPILKALLIS